MIAEVTFTRQKNYDSTEDSICMNCFLTVARGNESSLEEAEQKHDCEQAIRDECRRHEDSQRGTLLDPLHLSHYRRPADRTGFSQRL